MNDGFFHDTYLPPPAIDRDTIARFGLVILFDLGGLPQLWSFLPHTSKRPLLMRMLGLPESASRIRSQARFEALLQHRRAELGPWTGSFGPILDASLQNLADTLGLSAIEYRILGLATLLGAHECLAKLASQGLGEMDFLGLAKTCARLLGHPEPAQDREHAHMAVVHLPQPTIPLPGDPVRTLTLLGKAAFVDQQHRLGTAQQRVGFLGQLVAESVPVDHACGEQMLHLLMVDRIDSIPLVGP